MYMRACVIFGIISWYTLFARNQSVRKFILSKK